VKSFDENGNRSEASEVVTATPLAGDDDADNSGGGDGKPDDDAGDDDQSGDDDKTENRNGVGVKESSADNNQSGAGCGGW
jgi:hypothetical protein